LASVGKRSRNGFENSLEYSLLSYNPLSNICQNQGVGTFFNSRFTAFIRCLAFFNFHYG
jgi:hypothetical protein